MGFFGKLKKKGPEEKKKRKFTRIFFATDIHGSELCYRKFLNAAEGYETDILILGGDVTGKFLIPVIVDKDGNKRATLHGRKIELKTTKEYEDFRNTLGVLGYYHTELPEEEFQKVQNDQDAVDKIFIDEQRKRLTEWISLADQKLKDTEAKIYVSGGNDDHTEALDIFNELPSERYVPCEDKVVMIDELHSMASIGISNLTPWHTPREYPEEVITERIEECLKGIEDFKNVVFNFHVPPYGHGLDMCPELDTTKDPPAPVMHGGEQAFKPAGSTAVLQAIEKYQPLLVITGHIHETRGTVKIGRTFVVNPGSEYGEGALRGAIINLGDGEIMSWQLTSG